MSTQDNQSEKRKAARDALLDAITEQVEEISKEGGGPNAKLPRLKMLAETYALVVHGKEQAHARRPVSPPDDGASSRPPPASVRGRAAR